MKISYFLLSWIVFFLIYGKKFDDFVLFLIEIAKKVIQIAKIAIFIIEKCATLHRIIRMV